MSLLDIHDPLAAITSSFDPFQGTVEQTTQRYKAVCQVLMNGLDVTDPLQPHLMSLKAVETGGLIDCEIELDDRDARLPTPAVGSGFSAKLGWVGGGPMVEVFNGILNEVESTFSRSGGGGRRLRLKGSGANWHPESKLKMPMTNKLGDGPTASGEEGPKHTFEEWAQLLAKAAGVTVRVSPALANQGRDLWQQDQQSIVDNLKGYAQELGGLIRITNGDEITLLRKYEGKDMLGSADIVAKWGDNLISWAVTPYASRPAWAGAYQRYYDSKQSQWQYVTQLFGSPVPGGGSALFQLPMPAPNRTVAQQWNEAAGVMRFDAGHGRIMINGEPRAQALGTLLLLGARPGVDGYYLMDGVEHNYSRQGYTTTIETSYRLDGPPGGPAAPANSVTPSVAPPSFPSGAPL